MPASFPARSIVLPNKIGEPKFPGFTWTYLQKVLDTDPAACWPLDDASGSVAREVVGGLNGAYTGATLGQAGIGDGAVAPLFNGTGDRVNQYSAGLSALFPNAGREGAMMIWFKFTNSSLWNSTTQAYFLEFAASGSNGLLLHHGALANRLRYQYNAGGVLKVVNYDGLTADTNWHCMLMNWSVAGNYMKAYVGGSQAGSTQTGVGTYAGGLGSGNVKMATIDLITNPTFPGQLAYATLWNRPLTDPEIAALAVVP